MTQLYIGNLPDNCTEHYLDERFSKHGEIKEMILKGKFAFLTYEEPKAAELAIESEKEMDSPENPMLHVELANKQVKPAQGPVILHLLNLPGKVNWTELLKLLSGAGQILKNELVDDGGEHDWKRGIVTYGSKDDAQKAIDMFHETPFEGFRLQIICPEPGPNSPLKQEKSRLRKNSVEVKRKIEDSGFPVRIVVPSNMIGAIIGKEGKTIRRITDTTGARIDINRKDNAHSLKKEITVYGNADAINQAITMILKIMQDERATLSKPPIVTYKHAVLEILAHNNLIMSIFGPNHNGLRGLMDRTKTRIMITMSDELGKKQPSERHIVIEGTIEGCCHAQRDICNQLRNAFEEDMQRIIQMTSGKSVHQNHTYSPPSPTVYNHHSYKQASPAQMHDLSPVPHMQPPKLRYSPEQQLHYPKSAPHYTSSPISNEELLHKLLTDIHNRQNMINLRDLTDQQKQQLILAGQMMANSNINSSSNAAISSSYPKYSTPLKRNRYEGVPAPHNLSIPEEPMHHQAMNGYSPFREYKQDHHAPSQVSSKYNSEYDGLDMSSILHGLEDIIGSTNSGLKDDSGLGNSPTSPAKSQYDLLYHPQNTAFWRQQHQPRPVDPSYSPGTPGSNYLPYTSSTSLSYTNSKLNTSPRDSGKMEHRIGEVSYGNGLQHIKHSSPEQGLPEPQRTDFLSNSVLKRVWSNEDDSANASSFTLENSNLKKENQIQEFTNSNLDPYSYPSHHYHTSYPSKPNYTNYNASPPKNITEWSSSIPLPIASRIEVCKLQLEAMTGTLLTLSRHPYRENQAVIKVVGSVEGTQIIQKKLLDVCKQAIMA